MPELLLDANRGVHIPQQFAIRFADNITREDNERYDEVMENITIVRKGVDSTDYWEAWDEILMHTKITIKGTIYTLFQDGDLWAYVDGEENALGMPD